MVHLLRRVVLLTLLSLAVASSPASAQEGRAPAAEAEVAVHPSEHTLTAAYPNPFNPRTSFSLTVGTRQEVTVEVCHLYTGVMEAGESRSFTFESGDLPSGIYLYTARGETFTATRQVTLLK